MIDRENYGTLDPYTASSLLQKAIRRGETIYADLALRDLYFYRRSAVWSRLVTIAFEDVGLGDVSLVRSIVDAASEWRFAHAGKRQRSVGSEPELAALSLFAQRLSSATKSRSLDHLWSIASAIDPPEVSETVPVHWFANIAADRNHPLSMRARATIAKNRHDKRSQKASYEHRLRCLAALLPDEAAALVEHALLAFTLTSQPFVLLLPLLKAVMLEEGLPTHCQDQHLPVSCDIGGIPSYTFDKHTGLGKRAVGLLVNRNDDLKALILSFTRQDDIAAVAQMAVFHIDASPVDKKLIWSLSNVLEDIGVSADMHSAGCPPRGVEPVLSAVAAAISELNAIRRELKLGRLA